MILQDTPCDISRLRRLLNDELTDADQAELSLHVESCEICRQQLETLAAEPNWWRETRNFLIDTSLQTAPAPTDEPRTTPNEIRTPLTFLSPSDNPAMLGRLGEFEVLEEIGRGGMGVVLKGYDHGLNRWVAIKVLGPQYAENAAARKRFAREARAAAAVVHPHVVAIHAVDAAHQPPYFVMPFVPGESLQQRLDRDGPLSVTDVLRIGQQIAEGLAAAHAQGLVHRDIKPANILLERNVERVLITDFGLARAVDDASMTQSGFIAGTPHFMSPEQAQGAAVDHRSDLFSLGTVLYALLAGHSPFRADSPWGVLRRVTDDTPRPLREINASVPEWLEALIAKLQAKDPADRIQTAHEAAVLLKACLAHVQQPTVAYLPDEVMAFTKQYRRSRWKPLVALLVISATLIALGFAFGPESDTSSGQQSETGPATAEAPPEPAIAPSSEPVLSKWDDDLEPEAAQIRERLNELEVETSF